MSGGLSELRDHGRMTWLEQEGVWIAVPEEIVQALSSDGFEECKREMTTSRRDRRPAGGLWQGINTGTGSVAAAIWVHRPPGPHATVFIAIDDVSLTGPGSPSPDDVPYEDAGGEA